MTDKEKIRKEVERLQKDLIQEKEKGFGSDVDDACILELQNVLTYIDSLQEETVSNDLGEAACEYADEENPTCSCYECLIKTFKAGAKWGIRQAEVKIQAQSMALAHGCPKDFACSNLEEAAMEE